MNNGVDKARRAGKQRIATHVFRTRQNKGKPISMAEANELVDEVFDAMYLALANGFTVVVANFGSLTPVKQHERTACNPQTGERVTIQAQKRVKWVASDRLRDVVNGRTKVFTVRKSAKTVAK
jgi:nucleoid DNA-binding protein